MMLTDAQIRYMVTRFLGWRLPEDFHPDGGVRFEPTYNTGTPYEARWQPIGTNLLNATQAEAMVRYLVAGMPAEGESPWLAARKAKGWSTREAAKEAGVSASLVSRVENGREIEFAAGIALARAYGVSAESLIP